MTSLVVALAVLSSALLGAAVVLHLLSSPGATAGSDMLLAFFFPRRRRASRYESEPLHTARPGEAMTGPRVLPTPRWLPEVHA